MKYFIAILAGYYLLEVGRHFNHQRKNLTADDLTWPYVIVMWLFAIIVCFLWPITYVYQKVK